MSIARPGLARFVLDNSLLLLTGTAAAVVWANLDVGSYDRIAHPLHFVVNDIGMTTRVRVDADSAGKFVLTTADVEYSSLRHG